MITVPPSTAPAVERDGNCTVIETGRDSSGSRVKVAGVDFEGEPVDRRGLAPDHRRFRSAVLDDEADRDRGAGLAADVDDERATVLAADERVGEAFERVVGDTEHVGDEVGVQLGLATR